jgi:hypothetical protein
MTEEQHRALRNAVDKMMAALDRISTIAEGTPNKPLLKIHQLAGDAMHTGNFLLDYIDNERRQREASR